MRFLMLNWRDPKNPRAGGAERVSLAYLAALRERGHEAYWFANSFPGGGAQEEIRGVKIFRGGGYGTSVLAARRWYHQQPRFDLVIDQHHGIPWYAPGWSKAGCVAYIHEVLGPIWGAFYPWPVSMFGRWQERWTHWFYRNVPFWVPSESTKRMLHKHGVRNVTVIPNGIDTLPLAELEVKSLTLPLRLIAVSRLEPNKRVEHAIKALQILVQRGIEATLTIVGTGEAEPNLRHSARELGVEPRVTFTGLVSEQQKNEHLQRAHLLIHTSIREGWGLNVIEANAMGTPAIVYPVGGLVDSTIHKQTGLVTTTEAPGVVVDALASLLKAPENYAAYRMNAWERSKTFQWNRVLPKACDWLEQQARTQRRP